MNVEPVPGSKCNLNKSRHKGQAKLDSPSKEYFATADKLSFNTQEACRALGCSARTLSRLEKRGLLKSSKLLRTKLYTRQSLLDLLSKGE